MKNEMSRREFAIICFLVPMVFKMAMLPMLLAGAAGRDAYFSLLPLLVLDFAQLLLICEFLKYGGMQAFGSVANKALKIAVSVAVILIAGVKTAVFLAEAVNYVATHLFYNVTDGTIFALYMLAVGFVAIKGAGGIGKMCEIGIWIFPLILVLGLIFGDADVDFATMLPAFGSGAGVVFGGSAKYLFWSMDFLPLLYVKVKDMEGRRPTYLFGFLASAIVLIMLYMVFISVYGESASLIRYAFATLSAFNVVTSEIGSLEWTGSALWLTMTTVYLAGYTYVAGAAVGELGVNRKGATIVFATLVGLCGVLFMSNYQKVLEFATCGVQYAMVALELIVPAVCLTVVKLKNMRAKAVKASSRTKTSCDLGGECEKVG